MILKKRLFIMLEAGIIQQLREIFSTLAHHITFRATLATGRPENADLRAFLEDVAAVSDHIDCTFEEAQTQQSLFSILLDGQETGIRFRGIPNGHEFTSLLLAVLNADGQGKNLPDESTARRIKALQGPVRLTTYVSLTCTNCPDVVQALNVMALLNPAIEHEMVDGALYQEEVDKLAIQGVPAVYLDGKLLHSGRGNLGELLEKLSETVGEAEDADAQPIEHHYDLLVLGGGPAGASAAIYSARKGLKVAVVAQRIGGQVKETTAIENLISVTRTTGETLASDLRKHMDAYGIDIFENRTYQSLSLEGKEKSVEVGGQEKFFAPAVIIATGANWRRLNVDDEAKYIGHGVHFCPHCDGPFYKGKDVAVVGGGNSGIEAAIDLAGICRHVTVLEFLDTLKADTVLQEKLKQLPNVDVYLSTETKAVIGDGDKVTAIRIADRTNGEEKTIDLDGIFVQIGLMPNSAPFADSLETTPRREIKIDEYCRTSLPGVYAAGDVSSVPYKQIVIAMGEGAKAALSAFEDRMRT